MTAVDDAPDCTCGDPRAEHKRGTGGCRVPDCGCGKYVSPVGGIVPAAGPVLDVGALLAEAQGDADRESALRHQLAEVEQERDELARLVDQKQTRLGEMSDLLTGSRAKVESVERERDMAQAKLDSALLQMAQTGAELERVRAQLLGERADASRELLALRTEVALLRKRPAVDVLHSYDAWQCDRCGRRYTRETATADHACGPMQPVTVTVSRRSA